MRWLNVTLISKVFSPTDTDCGETLTRSVSDIPLSMILLSTRMSVSTPVVVAVMIQVREKEVPALRVVLQLRRKVKGDMGTGTAWVKKESIKCISNWELTFDSNSEGHRFRMVDSYPRYGLKSSTGLISSLGSIEAIEDQSTYETKISGRTDTRNGEVFSTANDIAPWIKPLHC